PARAEDADPEARARERVAVEELLGDAERPRELPDLDLVELAERLDDAPLADHLLDDGHAVVVRLDDVGALRPTGLDRVGVDGPLAEHELREVEPGRLAVRDLDERVPD